MVHRPKLESIMAVCRVGSIAECYLRQQRHLAFSEKWEIETEIAGRVSNNLELGEAALHLTRAQRRQIQKLADRVDRVTQADPRFFERFPHRQHRVQIASQAEIEQFAIIEGIDDAAPPAGFQHYVAIKNMSPARFRQPFTSRAHNDVDLCEAEVRWLYEANLTE